MIFFYCIVLPASYTYRSKYFELQPYVSNMKFHNCRSL